YLKLLESELMNQADFIIETYNTGELCLANLLHEPDAIILDYYLNGIVKDAMNGLEVLDKIKQLNPNIPVIMLSSQDSIDVAISCMHHQAHDYVIKNETTYLRLHKIINSIFEKNKLEKKLNWYMERM
ncbi:MAG: response regulator, partial [Saprospiraceae bacterium]